MGPVTAFKWLQVTLLDQINNVLFQINAQINALLLRLSHVVFMSESNECIKALLKWAQKSHQLLLIRITQKKLIGHATKNIWFTQLSIITKIHGSKMSPIFRSPTGTQDCHDIHVNLYHNWTVWHRVPFVKPSNWGMFMFLSMKINHKPQWAFIDYDLLLN